jgi:hypothetical protein
VLIEVTTFRLEADTGDDAFLDADRRVQEEFAYAQPGIVRRTTARGPDGTWLVSTFWGSVEDAEAAVARSTDHPAIASFAALVENASLRTERFSTLD